MYYCVIIMIGQFLWLLNEYLQGDFKKLPKWGCTFRGGEFQRINISLIMLTAWFDHQVA